MVCNGSGAQKNRREQLNNLDAKISNLKKVLAQGYRVHRQCKRVAYESPMCAGFKDEIKKACTPWYKDECVDIPIPIDKGAEEQSLVRMESSYSKLSRTNRQRRDYCFTAVSQMTVDEAFVFYSSRREPTVNSYPMESRKTTSLSECTVAAKTRRIVGAKSQRVIFVNDLTGIAVEVFYVNANGGKVRMGTINSGSELPIKSLTGHGFIALNQSTGTCLGSHTVGTKEVILVSQLR